MFNIRDNIIDLQGNLTTDDISGQLVKTSLNRIIQLSEIYGSQLGYNDHIPIYKDYIEVKAGKQDYNLQQDFIAFRPQLKDRGIKIMRLFHHALPAIVRYFDP